MLSAMVPYVPSFDYGIGVDTPSGAPCGLVVTGEPTNVPQASGGLVDFSLTRITTFEDFASQLGISAEASGGFGLFSASAKMDYAKKCKIHSNSLFMLVNVKVTQATMSIKDPHILPEADALLANGKMDEFRQRYGDMFIRGFITGGQFFGLMEIEARTSEQRESFATEVEASYGGFFSADFKYKEEEARAKGIDSVKVHCHIEGGNINVPLPVQVADMLMRARGFPSEIQGQAVPYMALLNSYNILATSEPPNFIDLQQQKDVLAQCAERRNIIIMLLNDIDFIMEHPNLFEDEGKEQLTKWSSGLNQDMRTIANAASAASNNSRDAKFPSAAEFLVPLPLAMPKPIVGDELTPAERRILQSLSEADQTWVLALPEGDRNWILALSVADLKWVLSLFEGDRNWILALSERDRNWILSLFLEKRVSFLSLPNNEREFIISLPISIPDHSVWIFGVREDWLSEDKKESLEEMTKLWIKQGGKPRQK